MIVKSNDFIDIDGVERLYEQAEKYEADYARFDYYEYA